MIVSSSSLLSSSTSSYVSSCPVSVVVLLMRGRAMIVVDGVVFLIWIDGCWLRRLVVLLMVLGSLLVWVGNSCRCTVDG